MIATADWEAMLLRLRDQLRDQMEVSDELATAIVDLWTTVATDRGLIWWEAAYWYEAARWIELMFPPGLAHADEFWPSEPGGSRRLSAPRSRSPRTRGPTWSAAGRRSETGRKLP